MSIKSTAYIVFGLIIIGIVATIIRGTPLSSVNNAAPLTTNTNTAVQNVNTVATTNTAPVTPTNIPVGTNTTTPVNTNTVVTPPAPTPTVVLPIADFYNRVTKKPFAIYITPKTSPVQPERFQGYHSGVDAETTTAEKSTDIPIFAIASGKVTLAKYVGGYGGVMMIESTVDGKVVTILYGHLRQSSFKYKLGATVPMGQQIAVLGKEYSTETDGERQNFHLGILNGASTNVKGYVSTKSQLGAWQDPVAWLKANGAK